MGEENKKENNSSIVPSSPIVPEPIVSQPSPHKAHTYEDDVAKAMNATDATVVQELLITAREREASEKDYKKSTRQRKWYSLFSVIFVVLAILTFGYAVYHYYTLTVPVEQRFSVGVFPNTSPIVVSGTDIRKTINSLAVDTILEENKPFLVSLVNDATTLTPISKESFFNFIEAKPPEPFVASINIVRLGILNDGIQNNFFMILSAPDPEIIAKEFLFAEASLLQLFYRVLNIDISKHVTEAGKVFESDYMFNLPIRVLYGPTIENEVKQPILLYAHLTNNIIIVTTKPKVLKSVYDTILKQ